MKTIKCIDSKLYSFRLKKFGRVKKIFWSKDDRPYYNRYGIRVFLDTVEILPYPYMYEDSEGKTGIISGYEYIGAYSSLFVEILDGEETVQLWTEV